MTRYEPSKFAAVVRYSAAISIATATADANLARARGFGWSYILDSLSYSDIPTVWAGTAAHMAATYVKPPFQTLSYAVLPCFISDISVILNLRLVYSTTLL